MIDHPGHIKLIMNKVLKIDAIKLLVVSNLIY